MFKDPFELQDFNTPNTFPNKALQIKDFKTD